MEILVTLKNVSKSFGVRPLFTDVAFVVGKGERIGLIGPNGAGKSTLLHLLAQTQTPDSGDIAFRRGLQVGLLEQTPKLDPALTVEASIIGEPEKVGEVLSKLMLTDIAERKVGELSGGWQKRVALARELVKSPELLLLDEPTNHLDIESILWLEQFLTRADFGSVIVTHDRLFLQRVTNRIIELDRRNPGGLLSVNGDYADYLDRKEELLFQQQRQETVLKNKLRRETEWLRRGPKARTTKQQARIDSAHALGAEVQELHTRNQHRVTDIEFGSTDKKPKRLIEAKAITKSYGEKVLFEKLNLFIGPGDRVGLLGVNGCGKSTLIRALLGMEKVDDGGIVRSDHLKVAYFEQNRETLDPETTLRKTLCPHGDQVNYRGRMIHINGYLDRFLFRKEQAEVAMKRLSGGEQARVLIARLMLHDANILVLDEPTNDLDVETLDVLEECLKEFDGAVLLVTHDRYFLDQVATEIHAFTTPFSKRPGEVIPFASHEQWENWFREASKAKPTSSEKIEAAKAPVKKAKRLGFNETRELANMDATIQKAEGKLREMEAEAQNPENASNAGLLFKLYESITQQQAEVERLYHRWSELEAMKEDT